MRYVLMIALMGLSSVAFAGLEGRKDDDFTFKCEFRSRWKGGSSSCFAWARVEREKKGHDLNDERGKDKDRASLKIFCDNKGHFRFEDRDAKSFFERDDLVIKGDDDGRRAILEIENFKHDGHARAELTLVRGHDDDHNAAKHLRGTCRLTDRDRGDDLGEEIEAL